MQKCKHFKLVLCRNLARVQICIHKSSQPFPLSSSIVLYEAEEISLGLCVHQELQLYCSDLSVNSFLTGSFGLASAPKYENIWNFSQKKGCARDGFHYRFLSQLWAHFLKLFSLFFLTALHSLFFLGLPAAGCSSKVPIPWPCDIWPPAVRSVSSWHGCEKTLHSW